MPKLICKCGAITRLTAEQIEKHAGEQLKCKKCGRAATVPERRTEEEPTVPTRKCPMCGADIYLTESECPSCGEQLKVETDLVSHINTPEPGLSIGGWLILISFGMVVGPIIQVIGLFQILSILSFPDDFFEPGLRTLFRIIVFLGVLFLTFSIYVAVNFFRRKKRTVTLAIWLYGINLGFVVFVEWQLHSLTGETSGSSDLGKAIVGAAVWIPYFLRSERVKRTFVVP